MLWSQGRCEVLNPQHMGVGFHWELHDFLVKVGYR